MIGAGCGIGEHNLSQHSVKWCEKSGLAQREDIWVDFFFDLGVTNDAKGACYVLY